MSTDDDINRLFNQAAEVTKFPSSQRYHEAGRRVAAISLPIFNCLAESGKVPNLINELTYEPHLIPQQVANNGIGPYYIPRLVEQDLDSLFMDVGVEFGGYRVTGHSDSYWYNLTNLGHFACRCKHGRKYFATGIQLLEGRISACDCPSTIETASQSPLHDVVSGSHVVIGMAHADAHGTPQLLLQCHYCDSQRTIRRQHFLKGFDVVCENGCPESVPGAFNVDRTLCMSDRYALSILRPILFAHKGDQREGPWAVPVRVDKPDGKVAYRYLPNGPADPLGVQYESSKQRAERLEREAADLAKTETIRFETATGGESEQAVGHVDGHKGRDYGHVQNQRLPKGAVLAKIEPQSKAEQRMSHAARRLTGKEVDTHRKVTYFDALRGEYVTVVTPIDNSQPDSPGTGAESAPGKADEVERRISLAELQASRIKSQNEADWKRTEEIAKLGLPRGSVAENKEKERLERERWREMLLPHFTDPKTLDIIIDNLIAESKR